VLLCFFALTTWLFLEALSGEFNSSVDQVTYYFHVLVALLFSYLLGRWFWLTVKPVRPESVTLGSDSLHYDPGGLGALLFRMGLSSLFFLGRNQFPELDEVFNYKRWRVRTMSKSNSGIWYPSDRARLVLISDGQQIEVGRRLGQNDVKWLISVLDGWRSA
jgi:hypothetical protein